MCTHIYLISTHPLVFTYTKTKKTKTRRLDGTKKKIKKHTVGVFRCVLVRTISMKSFELGTGWIFLKLYKTISLSLSLSHTLSKRWPRFALRCGIVYFDCAAVWDCIYTLRAPFYGFIMMKFISLRCGIL